jgi:hypothetical protein
MKGREGKGKGGEGEGGRRPEEPASRGKVGTVAGVADGEAREERERNLPSSGSSFLHSNE